MQLPQNGFILFSFVNTKLRDEYSSLDELCSAYGVSVEDICERMSSLGYSYDPAANAFK